MHDEMFWHVPTRLLRPTLDPRTDRGLVRFHVEDGDSVVREAGADFLELASVVLSVAQGAIHPDVLSVLHGRRLCYLHHEGRLFVALRTRGVPVVLNVFGPFRHHELESVVLHVHDVLQREEAVLGHPAQGVAFAHAHGAAREDQPRRGVGLGWYARDDALDGLVLPALSLRSVVHVEAVVPCLPELCKLPQELPAVCAVVVIGRA
mmetsp:Transcript_30449/g.70806  ORF Transcript_30449/g.70806 Transcript_30449/m.70806 type:complete len:206 (-) Transcript_30449:482-1099(-)